MSDWIAPTLSAIQANKQSGGMLGALQDARAGNSRKSFANVANSFALIAQGNVSSASTFYAQLAAQNVAKRQDELFQKALEDLARTNAMVKPKNVLDAVIYFADGATLDTNSNIFTKSDGTQIDAITGAEVIDPAFMIQMANGSYLNTQTNVLTMPDGTRIDTVTGLLVSTTA